MAKSSLNVWVVYVMKENEIQKYNDTDGDQLVDAVELLQIIFKPKCRPTVRWLRDQQKKRRVPFVKIGRLVFFQPSQVRAAMNGQRTAKFGGAN
jgi:hypothetical protein